MAWQLLNRRYTIGTVDGSGDITPGAAQTGFLDFTALTAGNDTYVVAVQGANWSYMTVRKVGAILRPQTTHDSSSGSSITFDTGLPISVFSDLGKEHAVYVDANGDVQNADALYLTFAPEDLTALKTTPLPSSGKSVRYLRGIVAGDGKSAFYVWEPSETATADDFNYVVSSLSATGRWVRQKPITEIAQVSSDSDAYNSSLYAVSNDLRFKNSAGAVKKIPKVESHYQATFATYAAFKAAASSKWTNGDLIEIRGITNEGDIDAPLTGTWDASNTNTTNLDFQYLRPDDISGSNPGRLSFPVPVRGVKFADGDASPSVKGSTVFICADTVPAAYTTFDDMRDGEKRIVFPGAQDATFTDSSTFNMGGANFKLSTTDAPVMFVKENGVIALIGGGVNRALLASTSNGEGAALIGVEDSAGNFTGTDVEAVLAELADLVAATGPESAPYNAVGNGSTNDTTAINAWIAAGAPGKGAAGATYLVDYLDDIDFQVDIDLSASTVKLRSVSDGVSGSIFTFVAGAEKSRLNVGLIDGNKATHAATYSTALGKWEGWMGVVVECADVEVNATFENFVDLAGYAKGDRCKGTWFIKNSGLGALFGYDISTEGAGNSGYSGIDQQITVIMDGIDNSGKAFNQHGCDIWGASGGSYKGICRNMDGDTSGTSEWLSPFTAIWCENCRFDLQVIDCMPTANLRTNCVSAQTNRNCDFNIVADNFPGKGVEEVSNENCRFVVNINGRDNVTWNAADTVGMNHDDNGWDADRSGHIITGGRGNTFTGLITGVTIGDKVQSGHPIFANLHVIGATEDGVLIDKNANAYFAGMTDATPSCTINGGMFVNCGRAGIAIGDVDYVNIDGAKCNDNGQDTSQTSTERCGIAYVSSTNTGANVVNITNTQMSDEQSYTVADGVSYNPGSTSSNKFTVTIVGKPPSSRPAVGQWINLVGAASGPADISGRIVSISGDDFVIDCGASKTFVSTSNTSSIGNGTASAGATTVTGSGFDTSLTGREWITDGVEWRQIAYVISDTQIKLESGFTNALSGTALVKLTVDLEGIPSQQYGFFNTTSIKAMYLRNNQYEDNVLERMRANGYGKLKAGSEYWYERKGLAPNAATYDVFTGGKKGHRLKYGRYQVTTILTSSGGNFTTHNLRVADSGGTTLGNIITVIDGFSAATTIPKNSKTVFGPPSTSNSLEAWAQEDWKVQLLLGATPDGTGQIRFEALIEASDADWANV